MLGYRRGSLRSLTRQLGVDESSLGAASYWMVGGSDYQLDRMVLLYFRLDTFNLLHKFRKKDWSPKKQVGIQVVAIVFTGLILLIGAIITIYLLEGNIIPLWNAPAFPSNYHW